MHLCKYEKLQRKIQHLKLNHTDIRKEPMFYHPSTCVWVKRFRKRMISNKLKIILPCGLLTMLLLYISDQNGQKHLVNQHNTATLSLSQHPFLQHKKGTRMNKGTDLKYILLYTTFFESTTWYLDDLGHEPFANCHVKNCYLTKDHNELSNVNKFDAILFHIHNMDNVKIPDPKSRQPNQISFIIQWNNIEKCSLEF